MYCLLVLSAHLHPTQPEHPGGPDEVDWFYYIDFLSLPHVCLTD